MTVDELADNFDQLPGLLRDLAARFPDATVVRNDVGNLAVLNSDGGFVAWVDVLTGEVHPA